MKMNIAKALGEFNEMFGDVGYDDTNEYGMPARPRFDTAKILAVLAASPRVLSVDELYVEYCGGHGKYSYEDYLLAGAFYSFIMQMERENMLVTRQPSLAYDCHERDYYYADYDRDSALIHEEAVARGCDRKYCVFLGDC